MSDVVELAPVVKTIEVRRSAADAFRLFTAEMTGWWPLKTHSRARDADGEVTERVDVEPQIGGRVYETLNTGEERDWGEVLAWEPGSRFGFSFHMGRGRMQAGEVEVRFETIGDDRCRVTLTHAHWERFGDQAEIMRGRYDGGWEHVFIERFGGFAGMISK